MIAFFFVSPQAYPQVLPDPDVELRHHQEREAYERRQLSPDIDVHMPMTRPDEDEIFPKDESPCFVINKVVTLVPDNSNMKSLKRAAERELIHDLIIGRCIGTQGIQVAVRKFQNGLIHKGYVTTRVGVPSQNLATGTLTLNVLPGLVQDIQFSGDSEKRSSLITAMGVRTGDVLNLRNIEQALENFKRNPAVDVDIAIEPAAEEGYSNLIVSYREGKRWRLQTSVDNAGIRATGRYAVGIVFSLDNPLRLNDQLYISINHNLPIDGGSERKGSYGKRLNYSIPFGDWLFQASLGGFRYHQTVQGVNQDYIYSGKTESVELEARRMLYRDAYRKLGMHGKFMQRGSKNYIEDVEIGVQRRRVEILEFGLNYKQFIQSGVFQGNLAYRQGIKAFGALRAPEEAFGEGTSRFGLMLADMRWSQPFQLGGKAFHYDGLVRVQWARTRLTPQDRFSIGGRYTVRGFDGESNLTGDHGWLVRNELSFPGSIQGGSFYLGIDHGQISATADLRQVGKTLTGAVVGVRGDSKNMSYEFFVGTPLKKPRQFRTGRVSAGFGLVFSF